MRYVEANGVRMSAIGVGCWQFGSSDWGYGRAFEATAIDIVHRALDREVNLIDTAEIYARGVSEVIVGRAVAERRSDAFVATKLLPIRPTAGATYEHGRLSAMRLDIERIDLYQLHWPNPIVPLHRTMQGMRRLVADGIIEHVGVSNYPTPLWRRAESALGSPVLSNQVRYNLVQRKPERSVLPYAQANDRIVIAYSPLAQGLLGGRYDVDHRPTDSVRRVNPLFLTENLERAMPLIAALREIAADHDATPAQISLAWLIHHPNVVAIPGASSVEQLEHNVAAADIELTADDIARLTAASDAYAPLSGPALVTELLRERRNTTKPAPAAPAPSSGPEPSGASSTSTAPSDPEPELEPTTDDVVDDLAGDLAGELVGDLVGDAPSGPPVLTDVNAPLARLRSLCEVLPETSEVDVLGHPTFRVSVKAFAVYEVIAGAPTVCVKLESLDQRSAIARPGIWAEPDTGEHGWTVVDLGAVPWSEVDPLVVASYRQVAAPELVSELDARLRAGGD